MLEDRLAEVCAAAEFVTQPGGLFEIFLGHGLLQVGSQFDRPDRAAAPAMQACGPGFDRASAPDASVRRSDRPDRFGRTPTEIFGWPQMPALIT